MQPDAIQPELRAFVAERIRSVAQLELLLLMRSDAGKQWTAAEAGHALYISPEMAAGLLSEMHGQSLLAKNESTSSYCYGTSTDVIDRRVRELAELYEARRVSVIALIYSTPVDKLQRFADGFRFSQGQKREE